MPQSVAPSYTDLVYDTLQAAERPLTFQELFDAVGRRRPITTRNPKATIRNALGQGGQLVSLGDGRYWYLPHCIRGSLLRVPLTEKKPANQPIALPDEVRQALWPSFFETQKRRTERPMLVRLPTGDEASLTLGFVGRGVWGTPVAEPLRRYLVGQRAAAGDSLLIRVLDAQAGCGEAWFESQLRRPTEAVAARNRELADAAHAFMRRPGVDDAAIWDIAIALLARGHYRAEVAPDDLKSVLRGDPRFEFARLGGWLSTTLGGESDTIIRVRELPDQTIPEVPPGTIYQLKVTLRGSSPPIWRRLLVPADTRLAALHRILQVAMGWTDSHLHQFEVGRRVIGVPSADDWREVEDERRIRLADVAPGAKARLRYEYDFGDSWEHDILVEKSLPAENGVRYPVCTGGRRACPPEDVGGVWQYPEFLHALQDPSHPEHEDMVEWIGGDFDPEAFGPEAVNATLRRLR